MAFFQNPFFEEFRGNWVLGDRQQSLVFQVRTNGERSGDFVWSFGTPTGNASDLNGNASYNLSGDDSNGVTNGKRMLTIVFAYHDLTKFVSYSVDVSSGATSVSAVTVANIVSALNTDGVFSSYFTAEVANGRVGIRAKKPDRIRFYIANGGAEEALLFNKMAGVGDLPTYFARHVVLGSVTFPDSTGTLVQLSHRISAIAGGSNPSTITSAAHGLTSGDKVVVAVTTSGTTSSTAAVAVTVLSADTFTVPANLSSTFGKAFWAKAADANVIANALNVNGVSLGLALGSGKDDWELLSGRSGIFNFQKLTVDSHDRVTQIIEYPTGAKAGDLARKVVYTYTDNAGASYYPTHPSTIAEIPYTLTSADLVLPVV